MKTFKNVVAEKSTEVTTVYFAQAESKPTDFGNFVECDESELRGDHLFTQNNVRYFGRL